MISIPRKTFNTEKTARICIYKSSGLQMVSITSIISYTALWVCRLSKLSSKREHFSFEFCVRSAKKMPSFVFWRFMNSKKQSFSSDLQYQIIL